MTRPRPVLAFQENVLRLFERLHQRTGHTREQTPTQQLGLEGERAAFFFLRRQNFTVVARRWRHSTLRGEVDLIAWEGNTLVFVEVKTGQADSGFAAEFRIGDAKRAAMHRMADAYIQQLPWSGSDAARPQVRFDAVSVYMRRSGPPAIQLHRGYL